MPAQFRDKIAIVTGGASGIGQALCVALCRAGACVIVADIDSARAAQVAASLAVDGGRARAIQVDVGNLDQVRALVTETVAQHGRLDYMFNNAAATATRGELTRLPIDPWHRAVDVNLMGVVNGSIAACAVMTRQGFGHIVNTGSLAGLVGFPTSIAYGATKAAVVNLSFALRIELERQGLQVTVVCPGPVHAAENPHLMGVARAAELILAGVARNSPVLVFPFSARLLWWLYRLSPNLLLILGPRMMRSYEEKQDLAALSGDVR